MEGVRSCAWSATIGYWADLALEALMSRPHGRPRNCHRPMRCPAVSCWLLQGPALRLAVSWYGLLGPPVNTAGAGVGLAWHGPRAAWCVVEIFNRRCAAGFIRFAPLRRPAPRKIHGSGTLGTCRVPLGDACLFHATPAWSQLPMRTGPVHAGAEGKWMRARALA